MELGKRLEALTACAKDLSSVPRRHTVAHKLESVTPVWGSRTLFWPLQPQSTYTKAGKNISKIKVNNSFKNYVAKNNLDITT